jgi:hypothetical protein
MHIAKTNRSACGLSSKLQLASNIFGNVAELEYPTWEPHKNNYNSDDEIKRTNVINEFKNLQIPKIRKILLLHAVLDRRENCSFILRDKQKMRVAEKDVR